MEVPLRNSAVPARAWTPGAERIVPIGTDGSAASHAGEGIFSTFWAGRRLA